MFRASDNLLRLLSHLYMHDIGFAAFLMYDADPTVIPSVRHSLMNGGFDQDSYLLSRHVGS